MTISEELTAVRTAITTITSGAQNYMLDGIQYNRANLKTLYQREQYLQKLLGRRRGRKTFNFVSMASVGA